MDLFISPEERTRLCQVAKDVAKCAYAPYSQFRVGAAVLGERGIYAGVNVENASYGLSWCAERSALSHAVAKGDVALRAIAVACIDADNKQGIHEFLPCGACRQWIAELAPNSEIIIVGVDRVFRISDLLPMAFRLRKSNDPGGRSVEQARKASFDT